MTSNLNLDQVASNQTQKEVTINTATNQIDLAMCATTAVSMAAGNVTLTSTQMQRASVFSVSGQTASRDLTIGAVARGIFAVINTDATYPVVVKRGSTSVSVAATEKAIFSTDGTTNSLVKIGGVAVTTKNYNTGFFFPGLPTASGRVGMHVIAEAGGVSFPSGLGNSRAKAKTASTGTATFDIQKNGASVGSLVFTTSATGVFTFASTTAFAQGDLLEIIAPGSQDATLADIAVTIQGTY
jgi:hypothetical protein